MKKIIFSLLFLAVFSSSSIAAEKDYKICSIGGYFVGAENMFLSDLAAHIMIKQLAINDPICTAAWKNAIDIGKRHAWTGKIKTEEEVIIMQQAVEFQSQVYDAITSNMDY